MSSNSRLMIGIAILLGVLFLPWWIYSAAIFLAIIFIPFYWEALLFAFIVQTLFTPPEGGFFTFAPLLAFTLLLIMIPAREHLRYYRR